MKILKFKENFMDRDFSWKDMTDKEREDLEIKAYKDLDFVKQINKCNCCEECTGEEGCFCGCADCLCEGISEAVKYHLDNNKPITENIFRPGSNAFYSILKEARKLFDLNKIELCEIDKELFESSDIGKFAIYEDQLVPLDLPMEIVEEINEADYKGKEVKLNKPMRSSGPKKYKVYVKNPKTGKVKVVNFGDVKGGLSAKVGDPDARRSFAARHDCKNKKDKTKPGYWACRLTKFGHLFGGKTYPGYW